MTTRKPSPSKGPNPIEQLEQQFDREGRRVACRSCGLEITVTTRWRKLCPRCRRISDQRKSRKAWRTRKLMAQAREAAT